MQMKYLFAFCVCFCFTGFVSTYSAKQIYAHLDDKDKKYFLQYLLGKGYEEISSKNGTYEMKFSFPEDLNIPENVISKFEALHITPENIAENFYKDFKTKFNLTIPETLGWMMGEIICLPTGECIDTGDAGSVCCT